jgi:hypothetical protein
MDKMELERLHIVDAIKGYKSKSVSLGIYCEGRAPKQQ